MTTRDWSVYRNPAVLLIGELRQVYNDGELELVDTSQFVPKILRKDFSVALNLASGGPDSDLFLHLFYGCGGSLNWAGYCDAEFGKLIDRQSAEANLDKRKEALWTIERKLAEANSGRSSITHAVQRVCSPTSRG